MLYDDNRVPVRDKPPQERKETSSVAWMQSGRRFVHDVDVSAFPEFACEFHALHFAAGKRRGGLAERKVVKPHIAKPLEKFANLRVVEELHRLADGEPHHVFDVHPLITVGERLGIVAVSAAFFARHDDRLGERHVVGNLPRAFADLAPALGVEREPRGIHLVCLCEDAAYLVH